MRIDGGELSFGEWRRSDGGKVFLKLGYAAGANQRGSHALVTQYPGNGELGQRLTTRAGEFVELAHVRKVGISQQVRR